MRYESQTSGICISVEPDFSLAQSDAAEGTYVFSYEIAMRNVSDRPARLLFRHWDIHDSTGYDTQVDGEGVVGEQPLLLPGDKHVYSSYCVLRSPLGFMEGYYTFEEADGVQFRVDVPRFELQAPLLRSDAVPDDDEFN